MSKRGSSSPGPERPGSASDFGRGHVLSLKNQLDENIDSRIPLGGCGSYGAPFKLTCMGYGYTVLGKGTTSGLWKEVSREAQVYRVLRKAQGSVVPVFLGTTILAQGRNWTKACQLSWGETEQNPESTGVCLNQ